MTGNERKNDGLTAKQTKAIQALLIEPTIATAAKLASVSESTLFRWLNDDGFSAAYRDARGRLLDDALTVLQGASTDAARFLQSVVNDGEAPAAVRVRAACEILSFALKAREVFETEERLQALESYFQGGVARAAR